MVTSIEYEKWQDIGLEDCTEMARPRVHRQIAGIPNSRSLCRTCKGIVPRKQLLSVFAQYMLHRQIAILKKRKIKIYTKTLNKIFHCWTIQEGDNSNRMRTIQPK